jgi:cellulose synthase/poly-beta-1,6-N-acetylglucosamine synthase-like glycosyltransferase
VIPCFNYAQYLPAAIDSALSQEGVKVDVVVVDDASTDDSLAIARRIADADPRVRALANDANCGAVETFNRGLSAARGEFLVRLDADDLLTPGALARAVAVMQQTPSVGLVYGHPLHFDGDELPVPRTESDSWTIWRGSDWLAARCLDGTTTTTTPEVVMRRSVVDVVGGQKPLAHTHDMEMWLRIAAHADVAYINGADQAWHREHPGSLSTLAEDPLIILGEIRDAFDVLFGDAPIPIRHSATLLSSARLAVARDAVDQALRLVDRGETGGRAAALRDFALACSAEIRDDRRWQRLERALASGGGRLSLLARLRGVPARISRRAVFKNRQRRWHSTGVYEQMQWSRGAGTSTEAEA